MMMSNRSNFEHRSPKQSKRGASRNVRTAGVSVSDGIGVLRRAIVRHQGRFSTLSFTASARILCDQTHAILVGICVAGISTALN
jgi:hypothetical protein